MTAHVLDPIIGSCLNCGSSREMLDDNLVKDCPAFSGGHKMAMIAIFQQIIRAESEVVSARRFVRDSEMSLRDLEIAQKCADDVQTLRASLNVLLEMSR